MASDNVFGSLQTKQKFIREQIRKRYRKILRPRPLWSREEIDEMSYKFQVSIVAEQEFRKILLDRLNYEIPLNVIEKAEAFHKRQIQSELRSATQRLTYYDL